MPTSGNSGFERALVAGTVYFLGLFALGFVLGTVRVLVVEPALGQLAATLAEVPIMLMAAWLFGRAAIQIWQVPPTALSRWTMVVCFLVLLVGAESLLGSMLFGRTLAEQWDAIATPSGIVGLSAQVIASLVPLLAFRCDLRDRRRT